MAGRFDDVINLMLHKFYLMCVFLIKFAISQLTPQLFRGGWLDLISDLKMEVLWIEPATLWLMIKHRKEKQVQSVY